MHPKLNSVCQKFLNSVQTMLKKTSLKQWVVHQQPSNDHCNKNKFNHLKYVLSFNKILKPKKIGCPPVQAKFI